MATLSSSLAWEIPWTGELGGLPTVHAVAKSWTRLSTHIHILIYTLIYALDPFPVASPTPSFTPIAMWCEPCVLQADFAP